MNNEKRILYATRSDKRKQLEEAHEVGVLLAQDVMRENVEVLLPLKKEGESNV